MTARVQAELWRIARQPWVWIAGLVIILSAGWMARWSPGLVSDLNLQIVNFGDQTKMQVSVGGAFQLSLVQASTGFGVVVMALVAAAGPGVDFVDRTVEVRRVNGNPAVRFGARVIAVSLLGMFFALTLTAVLLALRLFPFKQGGNDSSLIVGHLDPKLTVISMLLVMFHAVWITALTQLQRNQAAQMALPVGLILALFLASRLLSVPLTPDSWVGPLLGLDSERSMLDFWWSVGGRVLWPWGNVLLLGALLAGAWTVGIKTDKRPCV